MPPIFKFRNNLDSADIVNRDLGGILNGGSLDPVELILKNIGDSPSISTKIRVIPEISYVNLTNNPVSSITPLNNSEYSSGSYDIVFTSQDKVSVNGGPDINIYADNVTKNTNIINGIYVIFNAGVQIGDSFKVEISDGYENAKLSINGSSEWSSREISVESLPSANMTSISGDVIDGGQLGQTSYNYVVTAVLASGESLISNRINVTINQENRSYMISWEAFPDAIMYNIYKGFNGGLEKFLASSSENNFIDDGTLGVQENKNFPTTTSINIKKFWIKIDIPQDGTSVGNPRRFKLRAIGLSA